MYDKEVRDHMRFICLMKITQQGLLPKRLLSFSHTYCMCIERFHSVIISPNLHFMLTVVKCSQHFQS